MPTVLLLVSSLFSSLFFLLISVFNLVLSPSGCADLVLSVAGIHNWDRVGDDMGVVPISYAGVYMGNVLTGKHVITRLPQVVETVCLIGHFKVRND